MEKLYSLTSRGVVQLSGADAGPFLQGLITNDVDLLETQPLLYTAMLTPQGRYLYDFFLFKKEGSYYALLEKERLAAWIKKLTLYKLRSTVELQDVSHRYGVYVDLAGAPSFEAPFFQAADPRLTALGKILVLPVDDTRASESETPYRQHRYQLGVAESGSELTPDKSIILEYHFDAFGALSWTKGCYMGQELMARTKHRGGIHKEVCSVEGASGDPLVAGEDIFLGEKKIGQLLVAEGSIGLAMIRREFFDDLAAHDNAAVFGKEQPVMVERHRYHAPSS